jgi:hypothetical protein
MSDMTEIRRAYEKRDAAWQAYIGSVTLTDEGMRADVLTAFEAGYDAAVRDFDPPYPEIRRALDEIDAERKMNRGLTFEGRRLSMIPKDGYYLSVPLSPDQGGRAGEYWMESESMYAKRIEENEAKDREQARVAELKLLGEDYTCGSSPAFCKCPLHR